MLAIRFEGSTDLQMSIVLYVVYFQYFRLNWKLYYRQL